MPIMSSIVPTPPVDAPRVMLRGLAHCGKTTCALNRVERLAAAGEPPESVLLVVASPTAAHDARAALAGRDSRLAAVRVATAMEFELGMLDCPEALAATGRRARVMSEYELGLFMEDLRAEGIPTKNLKGMFGFFQRSWTELADDDLDAFVADPCEAMAVAAIGRYLDAYGAMPPAEVAKTCVRYLRACPDVALSLGVRHVVVDDYTSLNRASQVMLEMLEPATLWAFADPADAPRGADPFPYGKGVEEFCARNPEALVVDLPAPDGFDARSAAAHLVNCGYTGAVTPGTRENRGSKAVEETYAVPSSARPFDGIGCDVAHDPRCELDGVAEHVASLLAQGVRPSRVMVAVPNQNWARGVVAAFEKRGIPGQTLGSRQALTGDYRDFGSCAAVRMYAALGMLANPRDALSWRAWCSFGDPNARSPLFSALVSRACERGIDLIDAVDLAVRGRLEGLPGTLGVDEAYGQGLEMIGSLRGLRGERLLKELADGLGLDGVPDVFARACVVAGAQAGARELCGVVCDLVFAPHLEGDAAGVRVVEYSKVTGVDAEHVLVAGCMNGWFPRHAYFDAAEAFYDERQRMDAEGRLATYNIAGRASKTLRFSAFTCCDIELAEKTRLKRYRISMDARGRRVAAVRPSVFLDYALDAWGLAPLE